MQCVVMTPTGNVMTRTAKGETVKEAVTSIWDSDRGKKIDKIKNFYVGIPAMAIRQSTNWVSRSALTTFTSTTLGLGSFGVVGKLASGVIGGCGSSWNTPMEVVRIRKQSEPKRGYGEVGREVRTQ